MRDSRRGTRIAKECLYETAICRSIQEFICSRKIQTTKKGRKKNLLSVSDLPKFKFGKQFQPTWPQRRSIVDNDPGDSLYKIQSIKKETFICLEKLNQFRHEKKNKMKIILLPKSAASRCLKIELSTFLFEIYLIHYICIIYHSIIRFFAAGFDRLML